MQRVYSSISHQNSLEGLSKTRRCAEDDCRLMMQNTPSGMVALPESCTCCIQSEFNALVALSELPNHMEAFTKGGFGELYKGFGLCSSSEYVVKRIVKAKANEIFERARSSLISEDEIICHWTLCHPAILHCVAAESSSMYIDVLMPYMPRGDALQYVLREDARGEVIVYRFYTDVHSALTYLQSTICLFGL